jgi:restriction endonuclease S subunit
MPPWVNTANTDCYKGADAPAQTKPEIFSKTNTWKEFVLQDIFEIRKGQRLTKADMLQGSLPYIGASDSSNGITARIGQVAIHSGNTISVSYDGSIAEAFYQPEPFWASDAVNVLYPKNFKLTPAIALFLCTIIRLEKYRFTYGRKWHLERMRESVIRLPVTLIGKPNWNYMERYIKTLPYSSQIDKAT